MFGKKNATPLAGLDAWRLRAPDAVPLFSVPDDAALLPPPDWEGSAPLLASAASLGAVGLAVPIALAGGAHAVRMQSGTANKERAAHAMADPEIQGILTDPIMRQVLQDFQENPKAAQEHMKNEKWKGNLKKKRENLQKK